MVWALILLFLLVCPAFATDSAPPEIDYDVLAEAIVSASDSSDSSSDSAEEPIYVVPYEASGDGVATFSLSNFTGSVYSSTFSSSTLTYFERFAPKLSWSDHYVCFRGGQYDYYLFYGNDLSFSGSGFSGHNLECLHLSTYNSNNNGYQFSTSPCGSFSLDVDSGVVFSDLGHFPMLDNQFSHFDYIIVFLLFVFLLSGILRCIFSFTLRRGGTS